MIVFMKCVHHTCDLLLSPQDSHRFQIKLQVKQSKEQEEQERQRNLDKLKEKVCS